MKKRWIILPLITGILFTGMVVACNRGYHPGGFDRFDLTAATQRMASRLDLTESQEALLEQSAREVMEKAKATHADREAHRQQVADLIRQDAINKAVVDEIIDQKLSQARDMIDFTLVRLIALHDTLSPEQREKIAAHIEAHDTKGCRFGSAWSD